MKEAEYTLAFQQDTGSWHLLDGPASDHTIGDTRATILRHVRANPGAKPKDIAAAMDADLRLAVRWAVVPAHRDEKPPTKLKAAYEWLSTADLPVSALEDPKVFREVTYRLDYRLDGNPSAGDTVRSRRRALNAALE